ncbi:hypothetical protein ACI784_11980 [Geodermatophilus sp. SYSU D01186]
MSEFTFEVVAEAVQNLEEIGVAEGCTTSTSTSSLEISDVEFE